MSVPSVRDRAQLQLQNSTRINDNNCHMNMKTKNRCPKLQLLWLFSFHFDDEAFFSVARAENFLFLYSTSNP